MYYILNSIYYIHFMYFINSMHYIDFMYYITLCITFDPWIAFTSCITLTLCKTFAPCIFTFTSCITLTQCSTLSLQDFLDWFVIVSPFFFHSADFSDASVDHPQLNLHITSHWWRTVSNPQNPVWPIGRTSELKTSPTDPPRQNTRVMSLEAFQ